jgi:hypothetical protein
MFLRVTKSKISSRTNCWIVAPNGLEGFVISTHLTLMFMAYALL